MKISFSWLYKQKILLSPLILAAYPITFWYSENVGEVVLSEVWTTALVVLTVAAIITGLLRVVVRDNVKVAALVGILLIAFFSFGVVQNFLFHTYEVSIGGISIGQERTLAAIFICAVLIAVVVVIKFQGNLQLVVNLISFVAIFMALFNVGGAVMADTDGSTNPSNHLPMQTVQELNTSQLPDIYYIILDSYGRKDILQNNFSFDNSPFIDSLTDRGFFVADGSRANYPLATESSLASSLNMRYLTETESTVSLIEHNAVVPVMKSMGYQYVHIGSGFYASNTNMNADIQFANQNSSWLFVNEFSVALLNETMAVPLSNVLGFNLVTTRYTQKHAKDFSDSLAWLRDIPNIDGPTFTFSHNFPPHSPFVFDREGNVLDPNRFSGIPTVDEARELGNEAYIDQLVYVNKAVGAVVDDILERSAPEVPIIMIQGDHGPPSSTDKKDREYYILERTPTLSAFLLPAYCDSELYPEISPVNSFRAVLNSCFDGTFDLLEDETYWESYVEPIDSTVDFSKTKEYEPDIPN